MVTYPRYSGPRFSLRYIALAAAVLFSAPVSRAVNAQTRSASSAATVSLQGRLVAAGDGSLHLSSRSGEILLHSSDPSILHTLQDPRLRGRELRLDGQRNSDGSFEVSHLFTVRDGEVFRLRFYCHVCNIPATEPGPCVCCQRPTELEEIPVDQVTSDMVLVP